MDPPVADGDSSLEYLPLSPSTSLFCIPSQAPPVTVLTSSLSYYLCLTGPYAKPGVVGIGSSVEEGHLFGSI